jgi:NAD(P)-dependent dehydrogenase (short-subunit alcohol dehydrogenase family)
VGGGPAVRLDGVRSIVTGGGRGIGRAISLALAREGADVAIVAVRDLERAEQTAREVERLGRRSVALQADVTVARSVNRMVATVLRAFDGIDLLVNNAGLVLRAPLERVPEKDWDRVVAVNLKGVFLCGVAVARAMMRQRRGTIINIAGASAHRCYALGGAFGPSKAGVISLTKQMAVEWARHRIRVNGVSPGPIQTVDTDAKLKDATLRRRIRKIPLGRIGKPEEVARAVVYLASSDSSYVTGQVLVVDGGSVETWYLYP